MKIKVGVFFGGKSVEHEVSVISGLQACNAFDKEKYEVIPVYITKNNEFYYGEAIGNIKEYSDIKSLLAKSQRVFLMNENEKLNIMRYPLKKFGDNCLNNIDVAFPIVHGTNTEDGTLQGFFQTLNVPYVGCDIISSAVGMDKYVMKTVLKDNGINVLDCSVFGMSDYSKKPEQVVAEIEKKFSYPVIVKPLNLGSSVGIKVAQNKEKLLDALDHAFSFSGKVLVEKAITNLKEINCSVCGDYDSAEASECEEPVGSNEILSYEDKYVDNSSSKTSGMASLKRKIPAEISDEQKNTIKKMALDTFHCLGCSGVSRIDFMIDLDENKIYVNEINTIPGSLAFYLWEPVGVKYSALLDKMVSLALKRDRENKNLSFSFDTNILSNVNFGGSKGGKLHG